MIKVFILEDSLKRIAVFRDIFINNQLIYTASTTAAIEILAKERFDIIFLYHDLNENTLEYSDGTGYQVAHFLAKSDTVNNGSLIVIHTMNPSGGDQMAMVLQHRNIKRILYVDILNRRFDADLINEFKVSN